MTPVMHWCGAVHAGRTGKAAAGPCCRAGLKAQRLKRIRVTDVRTLVTCKRCLATLRRDARSAESPYPVDACPEWKP